MNEVRTVGDLRKLIANLPDDAEIAIDSDEEFHNFTVKIEEWNPGKFSVALNAV